MKYIELFKNHKELFKPKVNENLDEFPREIKDEKDVENWVEWSQNNTGNKKEKKLTMDFLDHYHDLEKRKDEENQLTGTNL